MRWRGGTRARTAGLVALIVGTFTAIALPQLLRERARAIDRTCDNIYVALNGENAGEVNDSREAIAMARQECGARTTDDLIACALARHQAEANPRNRRQRAFTSSHPDSCQVQLAHATDLQHPDRLDDPAQGSVTTWAVPACLSVRSCVAAFQV